MKPLIITETEKTPFVYFNIDGKLIIGGKSIPEDVISFYTPVIEWLENFFDESSTSVELHIIFEVMNASSNKCLFTLLKTMEKQFLNGKHVIVKWYCEENDTDMQDVSSLFREGLKIPIKDVIIDSIVYDDIKVL